MEHDADNPQDLDSRLHLLIDPAPPNWTKSRTFMAVAQSRRNPSVLLGGRAGRIATYRSVCRQFPGRARYATGLEEERSRRRPLRLCRGRYRAAAVGRGLEGAQWAPNRTGSWTQSTRSSSTSAEGEGTTTQGPTESQGRQKQPTREETGLLAAADRGCPGVGVRATCRGPVTGRARDGRACPQKAHARPAWPGLRAEERLGGRERKCGV